MITYDGLGYDGDNCDDSYDYSENRAIPHDNDGDDDTQPHSHEVSDIPSQHIIVNLSIHPRFLPSFPILLTTYISHR